MTNHKLHVFFSAQDKDLYPSVAALLTQLKMLTQLWYCNVDDIERLELIAHDTSNENFAFTPELVATMVQDKASAVFLVAPHLFLGKDMLNSAGAQALAQQSTAGTLLFIALYAEAITGKLSLQNKLGKGFWVTPANGFTHLSASDKPINDEAALLIDDVWKILEEQLPTRR